MKDINRLRMMGSELRSAWACPTWAAAGGGGVQRDWILQLGLADRGQPAIAVLVWGVPPSLAFPPCRPT